MDGPFERYGPFERMICLVGENPLPIYFGIVQLTTDRASVVLLSSEQTAPHAEYIRDALCDLRIDRDIEINPSSYLANPYDPKTVRESIEQTVNNLQGAYALNYTGGTKVMSAYALLELSAYLDSTFYLDESGGCFRFHDGHIIELNPPKQLTIETLTTLHGIPPALNGKQFACTAQDVLNLWHWLKGGIPTSIEKITRKKNEDQHNWLAAHYNACFQARPPTGIWHEFMDHLSIPTQTNWQAVGAPPPAFSDYQKGESGNYECVHDTCLQVKMLTGGWFERLVEEVVRGLSGSSPTFHYGMVATTPLFDPNTQLATGRTFTVHRAGTTPETFESDICIVVKNRLIYFSITTSTVLGTAKGKMFEAIVRSRQLGGGLTRVAVVAMLDNEDRDKCRTSAGTPGRYEFFGVEDIDNWLAGNVDDFWKFLTAG